MDGLSAIDSHFGQRAEDCFSPGGGRRGAGYQLQALSKQVLAWSRRSVLAIKWVPLYPVFWSYSNVSTTWRMPRCGSLLCIWHINQSNLNCPTSQKLTWLWHITSPAKGGVTKYQLLRKEMCWTSMEHRMVLTCVLLLPVFLLVLVFAFSDGFNL